MSSSPRTNFVLPDELSAREPVEARGLARDDVRLLVAAGKRIEHTSFREIGRYLRAGDLLIVNASATLAAAVDGTRSSDGMPVVVHFSTLLDDGTWIIELRSAPASAKPVLDAREGEKIELPEGARLTLLKKHARPGGNSDQGNRLWQAVITASDVQNLLARHGRPIRYGYVPKQWPIASYQTVFATTPGSAEMPSAARPFTTELVTRLVSSGVLIAPIVLHAGVSSLENGEAPLPERFRVPPTTARLVNWTRRTGGRVIAVGTTVVRALESAAYPDGSIRAADEWTELVLGPDEPVVTIDGLLTGFHAPEASHLKLLEAVAGPTLVQRVYDAAIEHRYMWHEFGDVYLLLPERRRRFITRYPHLRRVADGDRACRS